MRERKRALALLLSLLLTPPLLCAEEEAPRWYEVEVLLFTQNNPGYHDSEIWPRDYTLPDLAQSVELSAAPDTTGRPASLVPQPFSRIPDGQLRLKQEAERFRRAQDVELVLHLGWYQPGLAEDKARAVHLYSGMETKGASSPARLDGVLRIILSRYLHLEADMVLREEMPQSAFTLPDLRTQGPEDSAARAAPDAASAEGGMASPPLAESEAVPPELRYQVFHMQQSRRMRSGEIHYLDHPLFGIVALVTPYAPPAGAAPAP